MAQSLIKYSSTEPSVSYYIKEGSRTLKQELFPYRACYGAGVGWGGVGSGGVGPILNLVHTCLYVQCVVLT